MLRVAETHSQRSTMHDLPEAEVDVVALSPPPPSDDSLTAEANEKKYFCQRCLNHGKEFPRKGHKPHCEYSACTCEDCAMVETRRQLNNKLSKKKPTGLRVETVNGRKVRDPHCARCTAHGVITPLRGHKKNMCKFSECTCELCSLVCTRRNVMAKQIKLRRDQQRSRHSVEGRQSIDSSDGNTTDCSKETTPSPDPLIAHPQPLMPLAMLNMPLAQPPPIPQFPAMFISSPLINQYNSLLLQFFQMQQNGVAPFLPPTFPSPPI